VPPQRSRLAERRSGLGNPMRTTVVGSVRGSRPARLTAEPAVDGVKLSGCPPVFVNQTAEDIDAFHAPATRQRGHRRRCGHRHVKADAAMRASPVVVLEITGEDLLQVPTVPDQRPSQTLGTDRAQPPFCERIRLRRPRRNPECLDTGRAEHGVERSRELGVPIADQESEPASMVVEVRGPSASYAPPGPPTRRSGGR
jgi:hypothetical protein